MKFAAPGLFNKVTSLVTALALFIAPIISCCAGWQDASAAPQLIVSGDKHDCERNQFAPGLADAGDPQSTQNTPECDDCDDITKAEQSTNSDRTSGVRWNIEPDAAVESVGIDSWSASTAPETANLDRGPPPAILTTLVELSVLLLD
ncbi:MAG TPA: hypothetical protein QF901_07015 [Gammaproteobacteria bacterium]|jgi:hypothetical protein|nr:hypothetical protein [Gammaproteobacteria bacterium]